MQARIVLNCLCRENHTLDFLLTRLAVGFQGFTNNVIIAIYLGFTLYHSLITV